MGNLINCTILIFLMTTHWGCASIDLFKKEDPITLIAQQQKQQVRHSSQLKPLDLAQLQRALETHQLALGMYPEQVITLYGHPRLIEIAGTAQHGNEKWLYFEGLTSSWNLETAKVIYFETNQVSGWEGW